jgi:hypothetical protein
VVRRPRINTAFLPTMCWDWFPNFGQEDTAVLGVMPEAFAEIAAHRESAGSPLVSHPRDRTRPDTAMPSALNDIRAA